MRNNTWNINSFLCQSTEILFRGILTIALIRIYESLVCCVSIKDILVHLGYNAIGFCRDVTILTSVLVVLLPVSLIFHRKNLLGKIFQISALLVAFLSICLVLFFSKASFPLDGVLFQYSLSDCIEIVQKSSGSTFFTILQVAVVFLFCCIVVVTPFKGFSKTKAAVLVCILIISIITTFAEKDSPLQNGYNERTNKIIYFFRNVNKSIENQTDTPDDIMVRSFQTHFHNLNFINVKTPFLHTAKYPDNLSQFFELKEQMPNIVIVCVEGLCCENCGPQSTYVSATPWLDSLIDHSLFWSNCFSTSQKTCGALPAILGALPIGTSGFLAYKENCPKYYSLPKILEDNGYSFSFLYGGVAQFDDMDCFIKQNNGKQNFYEEYSDSFPKSIWGIHDEFLFNESFSFVPQDADKRIDFFLTLTTHHPWDYPNKEKYMKRYEELSQKEKKEMNPNKEAAASYMYIDDVMKSFFAKYKTHKNYENTIFIITGDHNFNSDASLLKRYHVPLIIWSPLLKKTKTIQSPVSQRDITPAIVGLLQNNYEFTSPQCVAWLSTGLDTNTLFQGTSFSPLIDPARKIIGLLYKNHFIQQDEVYLIDSNLGLSKEKNVDLKQNLQKLLIQYKKLDLYVCSHNALINSELQNNDIQEIITDTIFFKNGFTSRNEYFASLQIPLQQKYSGLYIDFQGKIKDTTTIGVERDVFFVRGVRDTSGKVLYYQSEKIRFDKDKPNEPVLFLFKQQDDNINQYIREGNEFFMYIWNRRSKALTMNNIDIKVYGIYQNNEKN